MATTPDNGAEQSPARGRGAGRRKVGERTRERVLDTAQELFANKGIDGVSINEICKQCDVNTAAVHYHFGSKANLIEEILRRGVEAWGLQRDQLIEELEERGDASLREVVEVMVKPTAALVEQPWGLTYVRFLYAVSNHPEFGELSNSTAESHTQRYLTMLERVLPDLPRTVLLRRYTLTRVFLYQAFSIEHGPLSSWLASHGVESDVGLRDDLIAYFTCALAAPLEPLDAPLAAHNVEPDGPGLAVGPTTTSTENDREGIPLTNEADQPPNDAPTFDPSSAALVLVDMQVGVTSYGTDLVPRTGDEVVANAARLVEAFHQADRPVIFVRVSYGQNNELQIQVPNDWNLSFSPPAGWDDLDPRLGAAPTDTVVTKRAYSAFHGTDLDLQLRRRGIETLVVGGIATHQGVEATVRAAHDHGYAQVLVEDAMAALSPAQHEHPVREVFPLFGNVTTASAVISRLGES